MNRYNYGFITFLGLLAAFIWLRDMSWISSADDTLPILVSIPLFIWLGMPWKGKKEKGPFNQKGIFAAIILFLAGITLDLTFLLAAGWTTLLWTWLSARTEDFSKKLLVFPMLAFPWVTLDASQIGWWFRLSGAWVTAHVYTLFGFDVFQEGTNLLINYLPISVEAACAGLNTLQSMLIAGTFVAFIFLKDSNRFWWNLPMLIVMAWIANTIRIITITASALLVSPEFAVGSFHTWGGWVILLLMFGMCWLFFSLQEPKTLETKS